MKQLALIILLALILAGCKTEKKPENPFVSIENGQFIKNGKPYYFIGANYWYGPLLGSATTPNGRARLIEELDIMKSHGIDNLRILAGAEGPDNEPRRVSPSLLVSPGGYNGMLLEGLDFLLTEMAKRDMVAVIYLNNSWEWSGGFAQYLNWNGYGPIPYPEWNGHTWPEFMDYAAQFLQCYNCKEQFFSHVRTLLNRTNSITGVRYTDDPTIMTWEIANEPRAFSKENKPLLLKFVRETAGLIKSMAPKQLVTTGTEGQWGCEGDINLFKQIHMPNTVDYLTMHIWPYNWRWLDTNNMEGTIDECIEKARNYMDEHIAVANDLNKPIVFEEFGLPRDGFSFDQASTTKIRDKYFEFSFKMVLEHAKKGGKLAGANFWSFGGIGVANPERTDHFWKPGDQFMGDPPQEAQGLNNVFASDKTMEIVSKYNKQISKTIK